MGLPDNKETDRSLPKQKKYFGMCCVHCVLQIQLQALWLKQCSFLDVYINLFADMIDQKYIYSHLHLWHKWTI